MSSAELKIASPFTLAQAQEDYGLSPQMVNYYKNMGILESVARGIYQGVDFDFQGNILFEELSIEAAKNPESVVCLISALCYYNMTDEMMREIWLAIPNKKGKLTRQGVRFVRFRNMELGVIEQEEGRIKFKIFDKERTIIDCFRYLDRDLALKSLKIYTRKTRDHTPDFNKLDEYARILRVNIIPYVEAFLVTL